MLVTESETSVCWIITEHFWVRIKWNVMSVSQRKQYNVLNIVKTEYYILTVYPIGPGRTTFFLAPQAMLLNSSNGRLPLIYL